MSNVAIKYKVVASLCDNMENLTRDAMNLQSNLGDLETSLRANWQGGGAEDLLMHYKDFVDNIDIITHDIMSVRNWCEDTTIRFRSATQSNKENLINAMHTR